MSEPSDDKDPGIFENTLVNLGGLIALGVVGAMSGLITARVLGAAAVGTLAVISGLTEFGRGFTSFTHAPSIIEAHKRRDDGRVFGTSLGLKLMGSLSFVAVAALLAFTVADVFHVPTWALILASLGLVLGTPAEVGAARYEAANKMRARNLLLAIGPIVGLATVLVAVAFGRYGIFAAILASLVGTSAMAAGFWLHWTRPKMRWDLSVARTLTSQGGKLVIAIFLTQVLLWTDTLMISAQRGNSAAGVYNVVFQISFLMVTASTGIGVAALPAMSALSARGADTRTAYQRATLLAFSLSLAMAAGYILLGRVFLAVYGPAFVNGYIPLVVLTLFGIAGALIVPAQGALVVHGKTTTVMLVSLAQVALNIPLNYVLIGRYGILGASVATTSVTILGLTLLWWLVGRSTGALPFSRVVVTEAWAKAREKLRI